MPGEKDLRCFLAPLDKLNFGQWNVTMNINRNNFGPYYSCIPEYTAADFSSWNVSLYSCNQDCNHPTVPGKSDHEYERAYKRSTYTQYPPKHATAIINNFEYLINCIYFTACT